jgi:hypothetical protein
VSGWVRCSALAFRVDGKTVDFLLVEQDGEYILLFAFIGVILIALDDLETLLLVQFDLAWLEEDLGEEVLKLEDSIIVRLL